MAKINQTSDSLQCLSPGGNIYSHCLYASPQYPVYYSPAPQLLSSISDQGLALIAPIIAYWFYAFCFHKLDTAGWKWSEKFRIHPSEEEKARNIATPLQVFWGVVVQQVLQTLLGIWWLSGEEPGHTIDHQLKLQYYADALRPAVFSTFGNALGKTLLPDFAYFAYWWGVLIFQFGLAM